MTKPKGHGAIVDIFQSNIDPAIRRAAETMALIDPATGPKAAAPGKTNRHLYILSIMTAFLLPPTLVTGFFGMNTGGLPFAGCLSQGCSGRACTEASSSIDDRCDDLIAPPQAVASLPPPPPAAALQAADSPPCSLTPACCRLRLELKRDFTELLDNDFGRETGAGR